MSPCFVVQEPQMVISSLQLRAQASVEAFPSSQVTNRCLRILRLHHRKYGQKNQKHGSESIGLLRMLTRPSVPPAPSIASNNLQSLRSDSFPTKSTPLPHLLRHLCRPPRPKPLPFPPDHRPPRLLLPLRRDLHPLPLHPLPLLLFTP